MTDRNNTKEKVRIQNDFQERVIAAQDFRDEVKLVNRRVSVNPDGSVTLYHGTSINNIESIKANGLERQSFMSLSKKETKEHIKQYKNVDVIEMRVDTRDISFSTGTQEVYIENKLQQDSDGVWKAENRIYKEAPRIL